MKLKQLQDLIHSDLIIIYKKNTYKDVWCYSERFESLKEKEVIGVRAYDGYVIVSIK